MNRRFCLTLDLKDDSALIAEYKRYHQKIWPEITQSIKDSGIEDMEIYLLGTRMFMIMEVNERFSFEAKAQNPKVQEWENLMWKFQQSPKPSPARNGCGWKEYSSWKPNGASRQHSPKVNRALAPEVCGSDPEFLFRSGLQHSRVALVTGDNSIELFQVFALLAGTLSSLTSKVRS